MTRLQREWLAGTRLGQAILSLFSALALSLLVLAGLGGVPLWVALLLAATVATLGSANLTVTRAIDGVQLRYWPFARRRIALKDIRSAHVVTYRPLAEYGGWGIKGGQGGVAWSVSGDRGVRIELQDGRHVLVGSRDPEALLERLALPAPGYEQRYGRLA